MARFQTELPTELMSMLDNLSDNTEQIFGDMTQAAADVVYNNIVSNMSGSFKTTRSLRRGLKKTRAYKTPSDDGINTHVGFYGYDEDGVPIPLKAMAREYGTSRGEAKRPFLRRSFNKGQIEAAMLKVQDQYIKGD